VVDCIVCDAGLFKFNRAPFGLKGSGNLFVSSLKYCLRFENPQILLSMMLRCILISGRNTWVILIISCALWKKLD